jgi:hypothetical protein
MRHQDQGARFSDWALAATASPRHFLSTAAKHGLGLFDALVMLVQGEPWIPAAARSKHGNFRHLIGYAALMDTVRLFL